MKKYRFISDNPKGVGSCTKKVWDLYWDSLTEEEKTQLKCKAKWEHMSLTAVAADWGVIRND